MLKEVAAGSLPASSTWCVAGTCSTWVLSSSARAQMAGEVSIFNYSFPGLMERHVCAHTRAMLVSHCAPRLGGHGAALAGLTPGGFCTPGAPGELCPGYQLTGINTRMKTARPPQPLELGRRGAAHHTCTCPCCKESISRSMELSTPSFTGPGAGGRAPALSPAQLGGTARGSLGR